MKTLSREELPGLPIEVKDLIAEGIYSLYELDHATYKYRLIAGDDSWCCGSGKVEHYLYQDGSPVRYSEVGLMPAIVDVITFEGAPLGERSYLKHVPVTFSC